MPGVDRRKPELMRALVVTVVHHPNDSRIWGRQLKALTGHGWDVTYAAPFGGYGVDPAESGMSRTIDLPRARGRQRLRSLRAAREVMRTEGPMHDVVLFHDPELLLALPGLTLPPVVWDVHEDTPATVALRQWVPGAARSVVALGARWAERWAERRIHLLLAEHSYQARFRRSHPVVPNAVPVPATVSPSGTSKVVYIGHLTRARGALELLKVGELLRARTSGEVELHLVGNADTASEGLLTAARDAGTVRWHGYLPSHEALAMLDGALAGLSLLHDEANYRGSMPTKVVEYMAHGVPVVATPLPLVAELLGSTGSGIIVPFEDPAAVVDAVLRLREDDEARAAMTKAGRAVAARRFDWSSQSHAFVSELGRLAKEGRHFRSGPRSVLRRRASSRS